MRGRSVAVVALAVVTALLLSLPLVRMWMPLNIDFGEGWNAYVVDQVAHGGRLYPAPGSLTPNNYPPLSFLALAALHRATGAPVVRIGRLVSLAALVLVALEIWWAARLCGAARVAATFASLFFVGITAAASPRYVASNDPQMLAHAITGAAVLLYLAFGRRANMLVLSAVLLIVSLFTKHNLVAAPLAMTVDLAIDSPGLLKRFCATLLGGGLVATALVQWRTDGAFISNILVPRRYGLEYFLLPAGIAALAMSLPLIIVGPALLRLRTSPPSRFVLLYLGAAILVGAAFSTGSGADVNMFFDAFIALAIASGLSPRLGAGSALSGRLASALVLWLALALPVRALTPARYRALKQRRDATISDAAFLASQEGPAYCEQMLLCYTARKPLIVQPYFTGELLGKGVLDDATVASMFAHGEFAVLQLEDPIERVGHASAERSRFSGRRGFRLTPAVASVIARNYYAVYASINGWFYLPVPREHSSSGEARAP